MCPIIIKLPTMCCSIARCEVNLKTGCFRMPPGVGVQLLGLDLGMMKLTMIRDEVWHALCVMPVTTCVTHGLHGSYLAVSVSVMQ